MIAGEMNLGRVWFEAGDTARLTSASNLILAGPDGFERVFAKDLEAAEPLTALSQIRAGKKARIEAPANVEIQRALIKAPTIRTRSERVLRLTTVQLDDGSVPGIPIGNGEFKATPERTGGVFLYGKELADLRRVNLFANDVLIQSRTVRLEEVRFRLGSRVILESALGVLADRPNRNRPVEPGKVNFVNNVHYGDTPAQYWIKYPAGFEGITILKLRD